MALGLVDSHHPLPFCCYRVRGNSKRLRRNMQLKPWRGWDTASPSRGLNLNKPSLLQILALAVPARNLRNSEKVTDR
jgi:hypothetical protein